jgi:hypothetical protein
MIVMRWRLHALALCAVGLAACSDRPTAPQLETAGEGAAAPPTQARGGPFAQLAAGDATAIPIGSPARIEFFGSAAASRRTLVFPLAGSPVDGAPLASAARTWLDHVKTLRAAGSSDPTVARLAQTVERLLAARTPEEVRAGLGPARGRITSARSVRQTGFGIAEHTASFGLDSRELLRVVTNARQTPSALLYCADDPNQIAIDPTCPQDPSYDPNFDPAPIAADLAAMQANLDALNAELSNIERQLVVPGECEAQRAVFVSTSLAFFWAGAEAAYYAWRRDVVNTYRTVKIAALAYGAALAAYSNYRACLPYDGRPRL